ncbi:hypothetical protein COV11_00125 [Candidatus Woesearchaeota archaeon CG10_big_fil_rev_8_21_14_0_10_30_7]|nr:MAG: hypothetical protein COV11_00125 [Candidatus Woesearchaeota archaeon CG10_big_fil_rev_8_21_14_0_10_30_7]
MTNTTRRNLVQQLEAQVEMNEQLIERNLESPTQFIRRVHYEQKINESVTPCFNLAAEEIILQYHSMLKQYER